MENESKENREPVDLANVIKKLREVEDILGSVNTDSVPEKTVRDNLDEALEKLHRIIENDMIRE